MSELPESVWQWNGPNPGPRVLVLGGVHGNELPGIRLVEELRRDLDGGSRALLAGTLTLALGNPRAIALNQRGSEPHADLNRSFTPECLGPNGSDSCEARRARELAPFLVSADVVLDLHATNKPSEPFLVTIDDTPRHRELCAFFSCDNVLVVPDALIPGTSDALADAHGGVGIAYETGWAGDLSRMSEVHDSVMAMLSHLGLFAATALRAPVAHTTYAMTEAILLTERGFAFAEGRGMKNFEPFAEGDLLGSHANISLVASHDGVILFPKVPELWKVGSPVGFLGRRAET